MVSDTVVAIIPEESLSDVLTQVHRAGLGNNARVLRPRRAPLREQLRRAGIPVEQAPERIADAQCVLMIMAAARSVVASDLVLQHGASATWVVTRSGAWTLVDDRVVKGAVVPLPQAQPSVPVDILAEEPTSDAAGPI
jgi:hypothetical protein